MAETCHCVVSESHKTRRRCLSARSHCVRQASAAVSGEHVALMDAAKPRQSSMVMVWYSTLWFKKNAPTLADYNYDLVQSILIIFSKLFVNDHKSCLVVKFSTSPHICCHYTLWNTMLYFALITLLIAKKRQLRITKTSINVKDF